MIRKKECVKENEEEDEEEKKEEKKENEKGKRKRDEGKVRKNGKCCTGKKTSEKMREGIGQGRG